MSRRRRSPESPPHGSGNPRSPVRERLARLFYLPIALSALATTLYHVAQKAIAPGVHSIVSLAITYATSLVACRLGVAFAAGGTTRGRSLEDVSWAADVVGPWIW